MRTLLEMRVGQMQTLGWGSAERRRLLAALRLERPSLQRWLDGQANTAAALPPASPAAQASTTTLSTPGAARSPAEDFKAKMDAELQRRAVATPNGGTHGAIPEGTPPSQRSTRSPAAYTSPRGSGTAERWSAAREFVLLVNSSAGGSDYRRYFSGTREVRVLAGSVRELEAAVVEALASQGVVVEGGVELLYADSRSGGDLVVLRTIGDLPSRARVTLTPATVASVSADADREELPNSLLQFVERESPGALERLEGSGTASPASSVASFGLTPRITPRMARADELLSMLEGLG